MGLDKGIADIVKERLHAFADDKRGGGNVKRAVGSSVRLIVVPLLGMAIFHRRSEARLRTFRAKSHADLTRTSHDLQRL
jgi:hypothetical protein